VLARGPLALLGLAIAGCTAPVGNDVTRLSQRDSTELLTAAVSVAVDSLAELGPHDLVLIPREVDGRDSTWTVITSAVADAVAERDPRVQFRRVWRDFEDCRPGAAPGEPDCAVLHRGLLIYLEALTPSPDSTGVTLHLGVSEPPPPGMVGRFSQGWVVHFREEGRGWVVTGIQDVWIA